MERARPPPPPGRSTRRICSGTAAALLREATPATPIVAKQVATERGYFTTNATRMQYPTFRRQGLPIGSGAVEAEAKRLMELWLKRPGMHWSDLGACAILQLRCHSLSGHPTATLPTAALPGPKSGTPHPLGERLSDYLASTPPRNSRTCAGRNDHAAPRGRV